MTTGQCPDGHHSKAILSIGRVYSRLSVCLRNRSAPRAWWPFLSIDLLCPHSFSQFHNHSLMTSDRTRIIFILPHVDDGRVHCQPCPPATYNPLNNSCARSLIPLQWAMQAASSLYPTLPPCTSTTFELNSGRSLDKEECNENLLKITSSDSSQVFSFTGHCSSSSVIHMNCCDGKRTTHDSPVKDGRSPAR